MNPVWFTGNHFVNNKCVTGNSWEWNFNKFSHWFAPDTIRSV